MFFKGWLTILNRAFRLLYYNDILRDGCVTYGTGKMADKSELAVRNDMPNRDVVLAVKTEKLSVIKRAKVSECLYKSLQSSTVEQNRSKLESLFKATKGDLKQRTIEGLIAVLAVLAAYERKFTTSGRWKGYLPFEQGFDLYSDFV